MSAKCWERGCKARQVGISTLCAEHLRQSLQIARGRLNSHGVLTAAENERIYKRIATKAKHADAKGWAR